MLKKTIITIAILASLNTTYATQYRCDGMSKINYNNWHLLIDTEKNKVIANGEIFPTMPKKIVNNAKSIVTDNFVTTVGTYVFNSINVFVEGYATGEIYFSQYNGATGQLSEAIELMCDKPIVL